MNRLHPKTNLTISIQPFMIFSSSTDTTNDRRNDGNYSINNRSDQHDRGLSSENNIRFSRHSINVEYVDFENENSPAETENPHNQPSVLHWIQKLSQKTSDTLSVKSTIIQYQQLEAKSSPEIIIISL